MDSSFTERAGFSSLESGLLNGEGSRCSRAANTWSKEVLQRNQSSGDASGLVLLGVASGERDADGGVVEGLACLDVGGEGLDVIRLGRRARARNQDDLSFLVLGRAIAVTSAVGIDTSLVAENRRESGDLLIGEGTGWSWGSRYSWGWGIDDRGRSWIWSGSHSDSWSSNGHGWRTLSWSGRSGFRDRRNCSTSGCGRSRRYWDRRDESLSRRWRSGSISQVVESDILRLERSSSDGAALAGPVQVLQSNRCSVDPGLLGCLGVIGREGKADSRVVDDFSSGEVELQRLDEGVASRWASARNADGFAVDHDAVAVTSTVSAAWVDASCDAKLGNESRVNGSLERGSHGKADEDGDGKGGCSELHCSLVGWWSVNE